MNIGEAAALSGVTSKTIRYYESIGLIEPAPRTGGGYRSYGDTDVAFLRFINRARSLGFSVDEVAGLLTLYRDRNRASADVKAMAQRHVTEIEQKIAALESIRKTLGHLVVTCDSVRITALAKRGKSPGKLTKVQDRLRQEYGFAYNPDGTQPNLPPGESYLVKKGAIIEVLGAELREAQETKVAIAA